MQEKENVLVLGRLRIEASQLLMEKPIFWRQIIQILSNQHLGRHCLFHGMMLQRSSTNLVMRYTFLHLKCDIQPLTVVLEIIQNFNPSY